MDDDSHKLAESAICRRLSKLLEGGAELPVRTRQRAEMYLADRAARGISGSEDETRDIRVEAYWVASPSGAALIGKPISEQARAIVGHRDEFGLRDRWEAAKLLSDVLSRIPSGHLELVHELWAEGERRPEVWAGAFWGLGALAEANGAKLVQLLPDIARFLDDSPELVAIALHSFCDWIDKVAGSTLINGVAEHHLLLLWDLAANVADATGAASRIVEKEETLAGAFSAPGGSLAETLLRCQSRRPAVEGGGLDAILRGRFELLANNNGDLGRYGRIRLTGSLAWLFWRAPDWVKQQLIRRMAWPSGDSGEAARLWRGFLQRPQLTSKLLEVLKPHMLEALRRKGPLGEDAHRELCQLFADLALEVPEIFSRAETVCAIRAIGPEGARQALSHFVRKLEAADAKAASLWLQRIRPWLKQHWPADAAFRSSQILATASRLPIATRDAFPDTSRLLQEMQLVGPVDEPFHLLTKLAPSEQERGNDPQAYNYVVNHPQEVCEWLDRVLPGRLTWYQDRLVKILERMEEVEPAVTGQACFRRLQQRS